MVDLTRKINEDAVIEGIEARTEAGLKSFATARHT